MNHKREYLSTSALKAFAKSPNHYIQYVNREVEPTPAMELGSAVHCAILEPDEWHDRYSVIPKIDRRTKAGKAAWETFNIASAGKTVLNQEQHRIVDACRRAVQEHPTAGPLLAEAIAVEQKRQTAIEGVPYTGIADAVGPGWIADLKTTADASPGQFQRQAFNLMYHEQAAAYREIWSADAFYFITVETTPPHNVTVFRQTTDAFERAKDNLHRLVREWKAWDGRPQSYSNEVQELNLPRWA